MVPQTTKSASPLDSPSASHDYDARVRIEFLVAGLAIAAALIHAVASVEHFSEYWLFGAFFVVLAVLQALWAVLVYRGASDRVLAWGALANACVVVLWFASRTTGLPIGPEPWRPEEIGALDVFASLDEVQIGILSVLFLAGVFSSPASRALRTLGPLSYALLVASGVALFSAGGHVH